MPHESETEGRKRLVANTKQFYSIGKHLPEPITHVAPRQRPSTICGVLDDILSTRVSPALTYFRHAAQLQYDDDCYYDDEDEERRKTSRNRMLDSDGWVPGRGVQWVLIGDRGAKKHLYAERLWKLLEVPHISMGSLVRQDLNPFSSLYKQIANAVNERKLVPDEVIFALLSKRLEEGYYRGENGFTLDGIPRTRTQAEIVDQIADIDLVVNLKCTNEHLVTKNLGTGNFSACRECLSMGNSVRNLNLQSKEVLKSSPADAEQSLEDYYRKQNKLIDFQVQAAKPGRGC